MVADAGETPAAPSPPSRPSRPPSPEPSWARVIATTLQLWLQRRVLRRLRQRPSPRVWRVIALVLVVLVAVGLVVAWPQDRGSPHRGQVTSRPRGGTVAASVSAGVRVQAAIWVAQQVSRASVVSCDPAMCSALQAQGFPAGNLLVIRPSAADPLGSDVIVATSVLRSQFGGRLNSIYAPVILASFGTGGVAIQIRAIAPDGAAVYLAQLRGDIAARKSVGALLLHNPRLHIEQAARLPLAAGLVDERVLATIVTLAASHPLRIVAFGDASPGASPGSPLRSVTLLGEARTPKENAAILRSARRFLAVQRPPFVIEKTSILRLATGQNALIIQFPAPAPLGLLGAGHSMVKIPSS